jgi:hypothetical protein
VELGCEQGAAPLPGAVEQICLKKSLPYLTRGGARSEQLVEMRLKVDLGCGGTFNGDNTGKASSKRYLSDGSEAAVWRGAGCVGDINA